MHTITLSNKKQFRCAEGVTILDAAQMQGLVLEHSCSTGRCGICKAHVQCGYTTLIKDESSLSQEELDQGIILTCSRTANSDVFLDIEDLNLRVNIKPKTLPCKINSIQKISSNILQVFLRIPPNQDFAYISGQHINIIGPSGIQRSYSIANITSDLNIIELHIRNTPDGQMSDYWFNKAKTNDLLRLNGPHGTFFLREQSEKNIIFLATGTGIAPIKSILEYLNENSNKEFDKNIYLYWGNRYLDDIYWKPTFNQIDIKFKPVLSRAHKDWDGNSGYVQNTLLQDNLELTNSVIYACGSPEMIKSAKSLLVSHGLNEKKFYSDAFVSSE